MEKIVRIGTRESPLALWQAYQVQEALKSFDIDSELVAVKSSGDVDLVTPLYAMNVQGVFTRHLDAYLLSDKIDIAVHSMKDVPTQLAQGITKAAILKRGDVRDTLILKKDRWAKDENGHWYHKTKSQSQDYVIGTGSVRRTALWLDRYPKSTIHNLRGNVQTRLRKLEENDWDGAIFAFAGLNRLGLVPEEHIFLDWMLPAPAQGAVMVVCREDDTSMRTICQQINDTLTDVCTRQEREFLSTLMGGCSTPISALATVANGKMYFQGSILTPSGKNKLYAEEVANFPNDAACIGSKAAQSLLSKGADKIVEEIRVFGKAN